MKIMDQEITTGTKVVFESGFKSNCKGKVYSIQDEHLTVETRLNGRNVKVKVHPTCVTSVVNTISREVRNYTYSDIKIYVGRP